MNTTETIEKLKALSERLKELHRDASWQVTINEAITLLQNTEKDTERLDWLESTKNSLERAYELDDEAQVMEGFWQVRDVNDCSLSDEEDLRKAIDTAIAAQQEDSK